MSNSDSSKQVLLSVIGVAILVVAIVGVSFAFFNYTRSGNVNTVRTGTIMFGSSQTIIDVDNVFPVAPENVSTDTDNVKIAEVTITGNTNYTNGIDFTIKAEDVDVTVGEGQNAFSVPVHITVEQDGLDDVENLVLGSFNKTNQVANNSVFASGKIPANTEVDGKVLIKVYLDASEVAITDTYPAGSTASHVEGEAPNQVVVVDGINGTTSEWVNGRTVLTTEQWNNLSSNSLSFKIRVEANEGAA